MKALFIDTWFWIALTNPNDYHHEAAKNLREALSTSYVVTTDEVFAEVLTYYASKGPYARQLAVQLVKDLMASDIEVIPQSRDSFLSGLNLYEQRPDKGYSLTDCISMQTMTAMNIYEVLSLDHHFVQEGFRPVLT